LRRAEPVCIECHDYWDWEDDPFLQRFFKRLKCKLFHRRYWHDQGYGPDVFNHAGISVAGAWFCHGCGRAWIPCISEKKRMEIAVMDFFDAHWREKDAKFNAAFNKWYYEEELPSRKGT
jgi:hypothetical protein